MVAKKNVQTDIFVSTKYNAGQRRIIGKAIIARIRERTSSQLDKDGNAFPSYTKEYAAEKGSSTVNLKLTGDMMGTLDIISTTSGKITIGYPTGGDMAGQVEGNQIGSYGQSTGNPSKARPFLDISQEEKELIISQAEQSFSTEDAFEGEKASLISGFINSIIRKQGE